jgi:hypothetical protein
LSAYSVTSGDQFQWNQPIEGLNFQDSAYGTASAQTFTLSFWVKSSITGTHSVGLRNQGTGAYRSYIATYTINSANIWEYKTITIPGDTSGTWYTDNSVAVQISFNLGAGSSFNASSANTWLTGNYLTVAGAANIVATSGATLNLTGIQFEKGSTATAFDYRPYGTELQLCQRYFETYTAAGNNSGIATMNSDTATTGRGVYFLRVPKRANPSVTFAAGSNFLYQGATINSATGTPTLAVSSPISLLFDVTTFSKTQWATANLLENATAGTVLFAISAEL